MNRRDFVKGAAAGVGAMTVMVGGTVAEAADWWEILHGHVEQAAPEADRDFLAAAAEAAGGLDWSDSPWPQLVARLKETTGRAGKALFHPLRRALTGRDSGPEMAALLPLIGRAETVARLSAAAAAA